MHYFYRVRKSIIFFIAFSLCSPNLWAAQNSPRVLLQTDVGNIVIELFPHEAPATVRNFLEYIDSGFYNDTIFHRVAPGFIIQGGGLTDDFNLKKTREPVKNEANNGLKNDSYMVAMAHTANGDLASAQFFINLQANSALNSNSRAAGYTVFGKIIEGMDVAEKISLAPRGMYEQFPEAPNTAIHILKAERIERNKNIKNDGDTFAARNENKSTTDKSVSAPE